MFDVVGKDDVTDVWIWAGKALIMMVMKLELAWRDSSVLLFRG